jgi:hypothetical protein
VATTSPVTTISTITAGTAVILSGTTFATFSPGTAESTGTTATTSTASSTDESRLNELDLAIFQEDCYGGPSRVSTFTRFAPATTGTTAATSTTPAFAVEESFSATATAATAGTTGTIFTSRPIVSVVAVPMHPLEMSSLQTALAVFSVVAMSTALAGNSVTPGVTSGATVEQRRVRRRPRLSTAVPFSGEPAVASRRTA